MASGVAVAARGPRLARGASRALGRRASVPPATSPRVNECETSLGLLARRGSPRRRGRAETKALSRPRRGRAHRVAAPPPGAFREDERGAGAAATTAEPDPKSPAAVRAASERNIRESEEAAEAAGASGGWWAWTKRWALRDSDEDSDEDAPPSAGGDDTRTSTGASAADAPEGDADRSFLLNRVPLPPWLKDQFAERVFPDVFPDALEPGLERKADAANARDAARHEPRVDPTETPLRARAEEERDDDDEAQHTTHAFADQNQKTKTTPPRPEGSAVRLHHGDSRGFRDGPPFEHGGVRGGADDGASWATPRSTNRARSPRPSRAPAVDTLEDALAEVEARARARRGEGTVDETERRERRVRVGGRRRRRRRRRG